MGDDMLVNRNSMKSRLKLLDLTRYEIVVEKSNSNQLYTLLRGKYRVKQSINRSTSDEKRLRFSCSLSEQPNATNASLGSNFDSLASITQFRKE